MSQKKFRSLLRFILIALLVLGVLLWATPTADSAQAAIAQLEEAPGQILYQNRS